MVKSKIKKINFNALGNTRFIGFNQDVNLSSVIRKAKKFKRKN